jgi:hypothetical protein
MIIRIKTRYLRNMRFPFCGGVVGVVNARPALGARLSFGCAYFLSSGAVPKFALKRSQ